MNDPEKSRIRAEIERGETCLGVELGSTRIKAVLIDSTLHPVASGGHGWENRQEDGVWTYSLEEAWEGVRGCFRELRGEVEERFGTPLRKLRSIGFSGMMHGYLPFDADGELLVPFRTWRNNITGAAAKELTELFQYPIPQRWSVAHLYQAILNGEEHVARIAHLTTLAGYIHWQLTGEKAMGIGEASGMFPIDVEAGDFDAELLGRFDERVRDRGFGWRLRDLLPAVKSAGEPAGSLTGEGARLLDPDGGLEPGIPLCPPEGDAGTGMVATNSVAARTGNVSAGTSVFAMIVLEKELSRLHADIDLVTTPDGKLVAMAHSNNCTSDLNAWMDVFRETVSAFGVEADAPAVFERLLPLALEGDPDCGGLLSYAFVSGEHVAGLSEGRPLFARKPEANFTLANFLRCHLFSALCAMRCGLDILFDEESVRVDEIRGHGGFFKTPGVGQRIMAAATKTPVSVLATAGEGGAWGIALLAAYPGRSERGQSLDDFLKPVFAGSEGTPVAPNPEDAAGFDRFLDLHRRGMPVERAAVDCL